MQYDGVEIFIFVSLETVQLTHHTHRSRGVTGFRQHWTDTVAHVELIGSDSREGTFGHVCCLLMAAEPLRVTLECFQRSCKGTHAPSTPAEACELATGAPVCYLSAS